ncbi:MAG: 50S ribosomal protein L6 [Chitinophagales bacterium]|nr:50S ribosomal protein L6 [Chitinophagales bacterium]
MSRIGNEPIDLRGTTFAVDQSNVVKIKGPKGELFQQVNQDLTFEESEGTLILKRPTNQKRHKAMHGLYRSLIDNMVTGVVDGYKKEMEIVGVGYRASASGQNLELSVGYSHPIVVQLPKEVKVTAVMEKGKPPLVTLESNDKQLIGQVAARIREIRKPEPYKGKGIRFKGEVLRRKAGKAASAGA